MSSRCTDLAEIPPISWSRDTKCPKKFSGVLYVMSLINVSSLEIWPHLQATYLLGMWQTVPIVGQNQFLQMVSRGNFWQLGMR